MKYFLLAGSFLLLFALASCSASSQRANETPSLNAMVEPAAREDPNPPTPTPAPQRVEENNDLDCTTGPANSSQ